MIDRNPLFQRYVTEHRRLLPVGSTHFSLINKTIKIRCDAHQPQCFSAASLVVPPDIR
jgi:hypothetical protein